MASISGNTANNIILSWMKEVLWNNEWCMNCTRVVSKGEIAKFFGVGGGTQIKLGISVSWYEKMGLLKDIK